MGGGRCGGSGVRGEDAIGSECLAPDDFFGYFLVRKQESNIYRQFDKLKFELLRFRIGRNGGMMNLPKSRIARRGIPAN